MKSCQAFLFGVCALSLLATGAVAGAAEAKAPERPADLVEQLQRLRHQRVATAERAVDALQAAFEAETVTIFPLFEAIDKLLEARLDVATTPAEEIDALEKRLQSVRLIEQKIKVLYEIGTRGGEIKEYSTAKRERETAEIELLKARIAAVLKSVDAASGASSKNEQ